MKILAHGCKQYERGRRNACSADRRVDGKEVSKILCSQKKPHMYCNTSFVHTPVVASRRNDWPLGPRRFRLRTAPALAKVYSWPTAARAKQTGEKRVVRGISRHGTRAGRIVTDSAHCEWRVACAHGINLDNMSLWKAHARRNSIVVANHYLNYTRK